MSLERAWAIAPTSCPIFLQSDNAVASDFQRELKLNRKTFAAALEYICGPEEDLEQQSRRYATIFQAETPGVMSLKELQDQIDLGQWNLRVGNQVAKLEVTQHLLTTSAKVLTIIDRISKGGERMKFRSPAPSNVSLQNWPRV